jgi:flagellar hook protein FlgE
MPGFYIPLSGLDADTTSLNTIANNLSNMSTTGFKEQTTNFSDLFYQELGANGSGDQVQVGTGVQVASNSTDFTSGAISSTGVSTDAAIDGSGFFILDNNGSQLYTRAGDFQLSSTGNLQSTTGQSVMGYAATNGVISTSGGLTDLTVPTGTVMKPSATSTFSMTQNLNSAATVGTTAAGQVQVYDSLGNSYEATINYTKTGNNTWSYKITLPDTIQPATAPSSAALTYDLSSPNSPVDPATNLVITGPTKTNGVTASITAPSVTAGESVDIYAAALNAAIASAGITGVSVSATTSGQLSIVGAGVTTTGKFIQDPVTNAESTTSAATSVKTFYFDSSANGTVSTVNAATNLTITGPTAVTGQTATITAPKIPAAGESLANYAAALNTAMSTAGISGVSAVATASGQLNITGPNVTLSGNMIQNPITSVTPTVRSSPDATTYYFSSANSTLDPSSNLTITGPTATAGVNATSAVVTPVAGETIAQYATALQAAATNAGIAGVTVTSTAAGQLSIVGAGATANGTLTEAPTTAVPSVAGTTFAFASKASTVDPSTTLTITGPNAAGVLTTAAAPTVLSGETISEYATALNSALSAAGITGAAVTASPTGLTINGSALTLSGSLVQNPITAITADTSVPGSTKYAFAAGSKVDSSTNLTITGQNSAGATVTTVAPSFAAGETIAKYVTALSAALTNAGIPSSNVSVAATGGNPPTGFTITGGTVSGNVVQDQVSSDLSRVATFALSGGDTVDPTTNLTITGLDANGVSQTTTAPVVAPNESLVAYTTALNTAIKNAGIVGVSAQSNGTTLSFTGAGASLGFSVGGTLHTALANVLTPASTGSGVYNFAPGATVDPNSTFTLSGLDTTGSPATIVVPPFAAGESLAAYATALTGAIGAAGTGGLVGVTAIVNPANANQLLITGGNVSSYAMSTGDTVGTTSSLTITGLDANGVSQTTIAPAVPALGESLTNYTLALNAAITAKGIVGVTATAAANGQALSFTGTGTGAGFSVGGGLTTIMTPTAASAGNGTYNFAPGATVDPTTNLMIADPGETHVFVPPTVTPGMTVPTYAGLLSTAITNAGIPGMTATLTGTALTGYHIAIAQVAGTATISQNMTQTDAVTALQPAGKIVQTDAKNTQPSGGPSTFSYSLTSGDSVDPSTKLSITGLDTAGNTVTISPLPTVTPGETLVQYAAALQTAIGAAGTGGLAGVTATVGGLNNNQLIISGTGITVTGNLVQSPTTILTSPTLPSTGTVTYNFAAGSTVDPNTSLAITGVVMPTVGANESVKDYAAAITAAGAAAGVSATATTQPDGTINLVITDSTPANFATTGNVLQGQATTTLAGAPGTNVNYSYNLGSSTATVDPSTNLVITGANSIGGEVLITAPTVTPGENLSTYAASLNSAMSSEGIVGVTATATNSGELTISGVNFSVTSGTLVQGQTASLPVTQSTIYNFGNANSTVDPNTNLTITAPTTSGPSVTIVAPTVSSGETVAEYATSLQNALAAMSITGVTIATTNSGQLSISGTNVTIGGNLIEDPITTVTNSSTTAGSATYQLASGTATVDPSTTFAITGYNASGTAEAATITPSAGETLASYATALQNAVTASGMQGVTVTSTLSGELSIVGPTTTGFSGKLVQNQGSSTLSGTSGVGNTFNFSLASASSTVDPATNLTISGVNSLGTAVSIATPTVSQGESLANYVASLNTALTAAGFVGAAVTSTPGGQMTISGTNISIGGSIIEDPGPYNLTASAGAITTISYPLASNAATIAPTTNLTITGPTAVAGVNATITAPTVTAGETVAAYVADLNTALTTAGIVGANVTSTAAGVINITGTNVSTIGNVVQDEVPATLTANAGKANSYSYGFAADNGTLATVNPTTNLLITGPTGTNGSATITAPTVVTGETLAEYVTALNDALGTAGISGASVTASSSGTLTISGVNITTSGNVVADPVSSVNTAGTLTFDANGNLLTPASNVSNITFGGLSDGAAPLNMTWDLLGSSGGGTVSQTAAASSTSSTNQNGYTSGEYQSFAINSTGVISATYSNGQTQNVGQLAVATVSNEQGLIDVGSTDFQTTAASGDASIGVGGAGGRGTIEGSSLEASNVNISTEFSDLIIAQRAFEANSKAITTFDTITQETINMIH